MEKKNYNDLMYAKELEVRQKHAGVQHKKYSHVFRKKSFLDIMRLSALAVGIGIVYGAETAFVSPTLLQNGVDHTTMTMVWGLSPLLGLLLGPIIGSIGDQCRLSLGRRRPIILLLSVGMLIGLICLPFARNIGQFFGDDVFDINSTMVEVNNTLSAAALLTANSPIENKPNLKVAVILTVLGVMFMDFNAETCQNPARAYMLDVCIPEDHNKILSTFSVMAGLGSALAYAIGGIDWESTALGQFIGGNLQTVFTIDITLFVVCFFITFFSFSEIPLPLIEMDKLLQPLNNNHNNLCINNNLSLQLSSDIKENYEIPERYSLPMVEIDPIDVEVETVSLGMYLKSIVVMPKSLWVLSLTNLLCWMGHICYCLYFTDFVGEEVFHGDPTAPVLSEQHNLYVEGVRFGGLGLAIYALSCAFYSYIVEKLMVWFKPKYVFVFGILVFAIGMLILAAWPSKLGVLLLSITAGIIYGTIYTVPYIILANYHTKGCFEIRDGMKIPLKEPRGLGTDIAIISSMLFIAQLVMSLSVGYLVSWTGTTSAIFYVSSGLSVCAAISAIFVLYI